MDTTKTSPAAKPMPDGWIGRTMWLEISPTAVDAVRLRFNPSGMSDVDEIKALAGTLITRLEAIGQRNDKMAIADATVAIRHVQTASMWAVFAATKGL